MAKRYVLRRERLGLRKWEVRPALIKGGHRNFRRWHSEIIIECKLAFFSSMQIFKLEQS